MNKESWEVKSKLGRKRIFETPEDMLSAANEYFKWCDANPFEEQQLFHYKGHITKDNATKKRPYTLIGLCLFLGVNSVYFNQFAISLKGREDELSKNFSKIITHIRETVRDQQVSGAASGFFNANIIARLQGLKDKQEIDHTSGGEKLGTYSTDELMKRAAASQSLEQEGLSDG